MLAAAMAVLLPDLAREGGDGGLAAGAGDGDHRLGLAREDVRGEFRQREARVVDEETLAPPGAPIDALFAATIAAAPRLAASAA